MATNPYPPGADFTRTIGDTAAQLRHIDVDLSVARSDYELSIKGNFLFADMRSYDSATVLSTTLETGTAFIRPNSVSSALLLLSAGRVYNWGARDPFDALYVTNAAQAGKMLRLYYSTGPTMLPLGNEFQLTTTGSVDLESPDRRTDAMETFFDYRSVGAGGAGLRSEVQLLNPAASGKNVFIEQFWVYTSAAGSTSFNFGFHNTALTGTVTPKSKWSGGASPVARIRFANGAAASAFSVGIAGVRTTQQYVEGFLEPKRPFVLPPGTGFIAQPQVDNILITVGFDWYERDVAS